MGLLERWFPLPEQYRSIRSPNLLKKYVIAYMAKSHSGWKPARIENNQVLAKWEGRT